MRTTKLHRILRAVVVGEGQLFLAFDDGRNTVVDMNPVLAKGGVFKHLQDPAIFRKVRLKNGGRAVVWPGGVDRCADALYGPALGSRRKPLHTTAPFGAEVFLPYRVSPK